MRRITLDPPSASERRDTPCGGAAGRNPVMSRERGRTIEVRGAERAATVVEDSGDGSPGSKPACGVTLERDHGITLPEAVALRNVLRSARIGDAGARWRPGGAPR